MDILVAESHFKPRWRIALPGDELAIGFVDRRSEQRIGEDLKIGLSIDACFARQSERLAEALDHRGDQEIAAELD